MLKHMIIWNLKADLSVDEKETAKQKIKNELEALIDISDDVLEIKVVINTLDTSTGDIMLDSSFKDKKALEFYASHPEHVEAAVFIKSVVASRHCIDYIV